MPQNELAITQIFHDHIAKAARNHGIPFLPFPLGSQDRKTLADNLLARLDYFCLVEMKDSERQLGSEKRKLERVLRLCRALAANEEMRNLHDQCHMIAFRESTTERPKAGPYRDQICNTDTLGQCGLPAASPSNANVIGLKKFAENFLGRPPSCCVSKEDFTKYVAWLIRTVTGTQGDTFYVLASDIDAEGEIVSIKLDSVDCLNDWLLGNNAPDPTNAPGNGSPNNPRSSSYDSPSP